MYNESTDVDPCDSNPCLYGQRCVSTDIGYQCECPRGTLFGATSLYCRKSKFKPIMIPLNSDNLIYVLVLFTRVLYVVHFV